MSTQRQLSKEGKLLLTNVIPQLEKLKAGGSILITDSPSRLPRIRRHLYNYFEGIGAKLYYRTIAESPTTLRVICKDLTPASATSELSFVENFFIDQLSACETHAEAQKVVSQAYALGKLDDKQAIEAIEEYERQTEHKEEIKPAKLGEELKTDLDDAFVLVNPTLSGGKATNGKDQK